jgi:hypothetical protein
MLFQAVVKLLAARAVEAAAAAASGPFATLTKEKM